MAAEVVAIIEYIAETVIKTKQNEKDLELILRLKLDQEGLLFKTAYLIWLINQVRNERRNKAIISLLLY